MKAINPCMWFDNQAEAAARFYVSLFEGSRVITPATPTPAGAPPPVMVVFEIFGQRVMAINGGPSYALSPAFSFYVDCDSQAEVDRYWQALLADGGEESRCGWLVDRFGVSWQVIPARLGELMGDQDRGKAGRVRDAMLKMRKIIVADLQAAHEGDGE
jgi:predicted 3-demethylubiquinone-9 3-methyltransferase (glyoxalase superfamily)